MYIAWACFRNFKVTVYEIISLKHHRHKRQQRFRKERSENLINTFTCLLYLVQNCGLYGTL